MKDMRLVRFNEKLKRVSTTGANGGLALMIAAFSRLFVIGPDPSAALWLLMSIGIILVAVQMNDLLQSEDEQ